jgi:protein TonB
MFTPSKIDSFALHKDNYISISLETPKVEVKSVKKIEKAAVEEKVVDTPHKNIDVNNLFSDVWTKKISQKVKPKREVNSKRLSEIQKKIKTTKKNDVKSLSKIVNNLEAVKTTNEKTSSSTAQQVNEYLAKIQAIVYQHFHVPQNSEGSSVKTVIELNALGKVIDFRILRYSNNDALNSEADRIAERLKYVVFPKNPQNRSSRTIVILVSKESN